MHNYNASRLKELRAVMKKGDVTIKQAKAIHVLVNSCNNAARGMAVLLANNDLKLKTNATKPKPKRRSHVPFKATEKTRIVIRPANSSDIDIAHIRSIKSLGHLFLAYFNGFKGKLSVAKMDAKYTKVWRSKGELEKWCRNAKKVFDATAQLAQAQKLTAEQVALKLATFKHGRSLEWLYENIQHMT